MLTNLNLFFRVFSKQQYFDSKGFFISIVFSVPILINCMIMVVRKHIFSLIQYNLNETFK